MTRSLWPKNPISWKVVSVCSALAVTTQLKTALLIALAITVVATLSCTSISIIRNTIPKRIETIIHIMIIAAFVIMMDQILHAYYFDIAQQLTFYVGLILTNYVLLERTHSFAMKNPVLPSLIDGLIHGLAQSGVLILIAFFRELLGSGTLMGHVIFPLSSTGGWYSSNALMLMAPSAFFLIALVVWIVRSIDKSQIEKD